MSLVVATDLAATWWHYLVLFIAVAASWAGVPLIGAAVAGGAGVAASQGTLDLVAVIVVGTIAGEVGGLIGYDIGFRWGRELLGRRPGKHQARRQQLLVHGERAYAKWGGLAVFFTPAVVSGTAKMRHGRFAFWNLLASLGFAVSVTASAYGLTAVASGHHTGHDLLILAVGVGAGVWLGTAFVRRQRRRARDRSTQ